MSTEDPETYLRRFAENQLRRLATGETTAAECAAHVDSVAVAFEETGALDGQVAARVADDLYFALSVRSSGPGTSRWLTQRSPLRSRSNRGIAHGIRDSLQRAGRDDLPGNARVIPAGTVLRLRGDDDEDVYLLGYVSTPERAWFSVAARTSQPLVPRRHASPLSARNPRALPSDRYRPTFAGGGMTATDDAGREYSLSFSGIHGDWYLGRLTLNPVPPPGTARLTVRCGTESAPVDLRGEPPTAEVTSSPLTGEAGERFLRRQAESLLVSPSAASVTGLKTRAAGLAIAVRALRAVGLLSTDSLVPGQVATLIDRLGGPGALVAEPEELPERWISELRAGVSSLTGAISSPNGAAVAAAPLAVVFPETDRVTVHLTSLLMFSDEATLIFGGLRNDADGSGPVFSLRDDAGNWHTVALWGAAGQGRDHTFQAAVAPPLGPETTRIEFYVTGRDTEVRADIPLNWWVS